MLLLGNNQENQFEGSGKKYERRDGVFSIMEMRFTTVRKGLINAENSPTITRAFENIRRLQAAKEALDYKQEIDRIAETSSVAESPIASEAEVAAEQPVMASVTYLHDRQQAIAAARAKEAEVRNAPIDAPDNRMAA